MKLKRYKNSIFFILALLPIYFILYKIFIPRVNAFGCFDDCFNIVAGYFIYGGKTLYSEIFFNHQMIMAYISYLVQLIFHPVNIYELILRHRQLVLLFGFIINALIVWRFRFVGIGFVLFYEFSKFYLFGDRFLAEGLIVYPLTYMVGILWYKLQNRKLYSFEYLLSAVFAWFIIFAREPFIPLAIFMFLLIMWGRAFYYIKRIAIAIFLALSGITLSLTPLEDYIFNVVTVNYRTFLTDGTYVGNVFSSSVFKIFFYPIFLFLGQEWNIFRHFIVVLALIFLFLFTYFVFIQKKFKLAIIVFSLLGLANLRVVPTGQIFYNAFHMLPWYGLFLIIIFLMLRDFYAHPAPERYYGAYKKKIALLLVMILLSVFGYLLFSPSSYIHEKVDTHFEFITNFGNQLQVGEVVKVLSEPKDTLFLDGADDLIYWQANRTSSYKYSWYTSFMPMFVRFREARNEMFKSQPPDFYYRFCSKQEIHDRSLPVDRREDYQQLYSFDKPTCLYIKKTKIPKISGARWQKAKEWFYDLPAR